MHLLIANEEELAIDDVPNGQYLLKDITLIIRIVLCNWRRVLIQQGLAETV